jgi:hypothetical protein
MMPINMNRGTTIETNVMPTEKEAVSCNPFTLLMYMSGKVAREY